MSEAKDKFEKRMSLLMAANDRETAIKDSVYIDYVIELKEACEGYALAIESQGKVLNNKITELEQQKAELIEFIKDIVDYEAERVLREREILLNKYK